MFTSETGTDAGGLALACHQLTSLFREMGHSVDIYMACECLFFVDGGYDAELANKLRYSQYIKTVSTEITESHIELIVSFGANQTAYTAALISKKTGLPLWITLRGSDINLSFGNPVMFQKNQYALEAADCVIGLSEELNQQAKLIHYSDKTIYYVIPNFFDWKTEFPETKPINQNSIIFSCGANYLSEKKGIGNLIKAFQLYSKQYSCDKLYLYGKIDEDIKTAYQKLINQYKLNDHVFISGYLSREQYIQQVEKTDVYLQASPFEGLCNATGEAVNAGKYVLISDTGFLAEKLKHAFPEHILFDLSPDRLAGKMAEFRKYILTVDNRKSIWKCLKNETSKEQVIAMWNRVFASKNIKHSRNSVENSLISVMFHDISNSYTGVDYAKEGFSNLVEQIYQKGWKFCSMEQYLLAENKKNMIVCTFDDGYEGVYLNAFPIMQKYGFTATVFVCPDLIGKSNAWNHKDSCCRFHMNKNMLDALYHHGWEIGSHGMSHYNMLRLSETELEVCLSESANILRKHYGAVNTFCYPYGAYEDYIAKKVAQVYQYAFAVNKGGTDLNYHAFCLSRVDPEKLKKWMV